MQTKTVYSTVRFRRWSRASYAVFASLHRAVSIGCVSADIADASLSKKENAAEPEYAEHLGNDTAEKEQRDKTPTERITVSLSEEPVCHRKERFFHTTTVGRSLTCGFPDLFTLHPCLKN